MIHKHSLRFRFLAKIPLTYGTPIYGYQARRFARAAARPSKSSEMLKSLRHDKELQEIEKAADAEHLSASRLVTGNLSNYDMLELLERPSLSLVQKLHVLSRIAHTLRAVSTDTNAELVAIRTAPPF